MIDVLAETLQKLTARRGLVARELATLDEAIAALQRVRDEAPKHVAAAARPASVASSSTSPAPSKAPTPPPPGPRRCAVKSCSRVLPPPVRTSGRPRVYCDDRCARRAAEERKARPASARPAAIDDDGEDPTDRALRRHREMNRLPESGPGYRERAKGHRAKETE